ncbi:MAG TPA: rod shape-determining protein RodA [Gammaproteobacteria bacterium]|nr:rod shape-determining protein RodA [Gammaproteobacteria bacterium]
MSIASHRSQKRWGDRRRSRLFVRGLHLDIPLIVSLLLLSMVGLAILYSASGQDMDMVQRQIIRLGVAFTVMFVVAQIPAHHIEKWAPWVFAVGMGLLLAVIFFGETGKGAQRWLDLGLFKFQPSEIMKIAVPIMVAWYLAEHPLPPSPKNLLMASLIIVAPVVLIVVQPDLGTSLLIAGSGVFVLLLSGIPWRLVFRFLFLVAASAPLLWYGLHDYQRARVLTFLNPEDDPLGAGYHIIQSKIAIGSGGLYGKGWLNGSQSQLEFLPERSTDFIFAAFGEEFGLFGILLLLALYLFIVARGLYIASQAQDTFTRLLAGSLILTFFVYFFVNISMVTGLLPVVGLPLPLISYGGTSMVTIMASFGILMSIHTHRKLLST